MPKKITKKKSLPNLPALPQIPGEMLEAGKNAGKKAGKVIGEFKEFISRGNVTDMAVGIIVGTSFTAIVNSLVKDIITPLMGLIIGGIDFTTLSVTVKSPFFSNFSVSIDYGKFIQTIISFFIIAVCVFFMVKALNAVRRKPPPEDPKPTEQVVLLTEIRDLLRGDIVPETSDDSGKPVTPKKAVHPVKKKKRTR